MSLENWKDRLYAQTQGFVDVDRDHPRLSRYFERPFFEDQEWWNDAEKVFIPEEKAILDSSLINYFSPDGIFFADKSPGSQKCFELLIDSSLTFRVFPTDRHIKKTAFGLIILDLVYEGEKSIAGLVKVWEESRERMAKVFEVEIPKVGLKPDPVVGSMMRKVESIQRDRARKEMQDLLQSPANV